MNYVKGELAEGKDIYGILTCGKRFLCVVKSFRKNRIGRLEIIVSRVEIAKGIIGVGITYVDLCFLYKCPVQ